MESQELWTLLDAIDELQGKGKVIEKSIEEGEMTLDEKVRFRAEANIYKNIAGALKSLLEKLTSYKKEQFLPASPGR